MRIFLDATTISSGHSGTGTYARNLLHALPRLSGTEHVHAAVSRDIAHILPILPKTTLSSTHPSPHRVLNHRLIGNRERIPADIALFPNYFMPFFWEIPSAVTVHDVSFLTHPQYYSIKMRQWYRRRIRHSIARARYILTVSEASARQINRHLNVSRSRILVHPPCWLEPREILPPEKRTQTLLYLGNMEPRKNVLTLIEAFNNSGLDNYRLELVGKLHAGRSWLRRFHKLTDNSERVRWMGYLSDDKVKRRISEASGLVNLSFVEGFGLPQAEALSAGTPCLISDDAAMQEVGGGRSLVTDPHDPARISRDMRELATFGFDKSRRHAEEMWKRYSRKRYMESLREIADRLEAGNNTIFPVLGAAKPGSTKGVLAAASYAAVFGEALSAVKMYQAFPVPVSGVEQVRRKADRLTKQFPDQFSMHRDRFHILRYAPLKETKRDNRADHARIRQRHRLLLRLLGTLPLIRAVYYSGGTSHQNSLYDKPDLDLFIVTRKNTVWISYLFVRLLSIIMLRKESCCSNYLVDEQAQEIFWQRDHYSAFQLLFLKQVFRKPGTMHIRQCNPWMLQLFPNSPGASRHTGEAGKNNAGNAGPVPAAKGFLFAANLVVMRLLTSRWERVGKKNRAGGLMWDAFRIKLHTNDHRPWVYRRYEDILQNTLDSMVPLGTVKLRKVSRNW
ncbi:glycosyltransferase family 1 protein [Balneolales bacterium ANBcel1]|nr:glycosyltransferase family 1 protein [Balneolales bacterium ANBcel1]